MKNKKLTLVCNRTQMFQTCKLLLENIFYNFILIFFIWLHILFLMWAVSVRLKILVLKKKKNLRIIYEFPLHRNSVFTQIFPNRTSFKFFNLYHFNTSEKKFFYYRFRYLLCLPHSYIMWYWGKHKWKLQLLEMACKIILLINSWGD